MKIYCVIFTLSYIVACAYAAVAIFPYEPKPPQFACMEGCYLSSLNRVLPYNKPYYPKGKCLRYTCNTNNETQLVSCGALAVPPNCRLVQDLKKKYSDCCGSPVCDPTTTTEAPTTVDTACDK